MTPVWTILLLTVHLLNVSQGCIDVASCTCDNNNLQCKGANFKTIPFRLPNTIISVVMDHGQLNTVDTTSLLHLHNLTLLQLDYNKISYIEADAFQTHSRLLKVSLHANALHTLSEGIFVNLKHLQVLKLSENSLTSLDGVLNGLISLQVLVANDNLLTHISAETFKDLKDLQRLELGNNKLSNLEPATFHHSPNLISLGMGSNPITSFEKLFNNDSVLHFMNISACNLTKFPVDLPATIQFLVLSKNRINEINKSDTVKYVNLNSLILEGNNMSYIENGAFLHTTQLQSLYLYVNALREVPGPFTQNIKQIYLDDNIISGLAPDLFLPGTQLEVLSLKNNNINTFTFNLPKNFRVKSLHFEGNPLQSLRNNMFVQLSGLEQLVLNRLHLQVIFVDCFLGLYNLKVLEMSHVQLQSHPVDFLYNIQALQVLKFKNSPHLAEYLVSSELSSSVLPRLNNLTELNIEDNNLTDLDQSIMTLPNLKKLYLSGNLFHCVLDLLWLQVWYIASPDVLPDLANVHCHVPRTVRGLKFVDVALTGFDIVNDTMYDTNTDSVYDYTNHDTYTYDYEDSYGTEYPTDPYIHDYEHDYDYTPYSNYDYNDIYYHTSDTISTDSTPNITSDTNATSVSPTTPPLTTVETITTDADTIIDTQTDESTAATPSSATATNLTVQPTTPSMRDHVPGENEEQRESSEFTVKNVGIVIGMSVGVIVLMLLITAIVFLLLRRRQTVVHHNAREYPKDNYVFIVSKNDAAPTAIPTVQQNLTREQRGSTTSRASEDITNITGNSMKVYTLDVDG